MKLSYDNKAERLFRTVLSAIFAVSAFLFWQLVLPYHLHYQEEIQLFPFTLDHLLQAMTFPGGLASYFAEFIVQFFYFGWLGALLTSILILLCHLLSWSVIKTFRPEAGPSFYALSFVPAVCIWAFLCDEGNLYSAVTAFVLVNAAWLSYCSSVQCSLVQYLKAGLLTALLYFVCGPIAYLFAVYSLLYAKTSHSRESFKIALLSFAVLVASLLLSRAIFVQYPFKRLCLGVEYSHINGQYTLTYWLLYASTLLTALLAAFMPAKKISEKAKLAMLSFSIICVLSVSFTFVGKHVSKERESMYAYDYCASNRQWGKIISMAEKKTPKTPAEVTCLNTALVMTGQSPSRLFDFFQAGVPGLFPNYDGYSSLKKTGSEALFQAGLLNMALHYTFEAYQTFPGFRGSGRHIKRMAELNLIKADYALAQKYLRLLSPTLFYGKWARKYLSEPKSIAEDSEYSRLLTCLSDDSEIYDDMNEFSKQFALRDLVSKNPVDGPSWHFLLAYDMLARDVEAFLADFMLVKTEGNVPLLYQEALALPWIINGGIGELDTEHVSPQVRDYAMELIRDLSARKSLGYIQKLYGHTIWYYFMDITSK